MSTATDRRNRAVLTPSPSSLYIGGQWRGDGRLDLGVEDTRTAGGPLVEVADAKPETMRGGSGRRLEAQGRVGANPPRERGGDTEPGSGRRRWESARTSSPSHDLEMRQDGRVEGRDAYAGEFFRWLAEQAGG